MKRTLSAIAILLATGATAQAQNLEKMAGGFALLGPNGNRIGSVQISADGSLRTRLDDGSTRPDMTLDRARSSAARAIFTSPAQEPSTGLVDVIVGDPGGPTTGTPARTLELTSADMRAVLKEGNAVIARERLQRVKAALIVHASTYDTTHVSAFRGYATRLAARYREMGYTTAETLLGTSMNLVVDRLNRAADEARPFDRLIFIGHGGWDGPVLGKYDEGGEGAVHQASSHYNPEVFAKLVDAIKRGTNPTAGIFSSSCHGGGNDRYERARQLNPYIWSDDVAHQTGRTAAGPAGYTSTEYTMQHVMAVLEGQGVTVQEVRWASPRGVRSIMPKRSLESTALQPVAPIHMPAPPAPPTPAEPVAEPVAATTPSPATPAAPVVNMALGD